ncbi:hypothetical protein AAFF_G00386350 [Aldrovandia affinis]|uniref:Transmembrane protein 5 n=1 Tax=Aldrovandia affinis TaxID=143900 RepID=A0AAD7SFB5_9TELE|nr:hypothetical protein AAFF_G00386350 [Aldrovandia affinis]
MKFGRRKICFCVVLLYLVFSLYAAYNVFFNTKAISRVHRVVKKVTAAGGVKAGEGSQRNGAGDWWNPWEDERAESLSILQRRREGFRAYQAQIAKDRPKRHKVQIWGKAAIGLYLWEHILEGPLNPTDRTAQWREGEVQSGTISFRFYTGPAVVQGQVPLDTDSMVLVLNGREEQKVAYATRWLQHAGALVQARALSRVAVVMLGSERCSNDWLRPYLKAQGGFVDLLFLVYDSPWVNNRDVLQWPLGVATYREFPVVSPSAELVSSVRPYLCNFLGTVYRNSSRESLMGILKQQGLERDCIITGREKWVPQETADSLQRYQTALAQSDLTLCPVGVNAECYRIYEACAYGSVPVVEDVGTPGECAAGKAGAGPGEGHGSPLRLLKAAGAPFLFLRDWAELPALLERERGMTRREKEERRRRLMEWYGTFRMRMRDRFTQVLEEAFFRAG